MNKDKIKVYKTIFDFTTPICLTSMVIAGVVKCFGGGLPFKIDDQTKYKCSKVSMVSSETISEEIKYETVNSFENNNKDVKNTITIYSPWKEEDGKYNRTIRYYYLKKIDDNYLFTALLNKDFKYINNSYSNYNEEQEFINKVPSEYNDTLVDADIYYIDKCDFVIEKESDGRNSLITSLELLFGIPFGIIISGTINAQKEEKKKILSLGGDKYDD